MSAASHTPGPWTDFPPRQITGKPTRYYGYIGHERLEEHCCAAGDPPGTHRHPRLAVACARRAATKRNNVYAAALKLSPEGKYLALLAAARAVLECPDYRAISTLEMKALRRAVEEAEK